MGGKQALLIGVGHYGEGLAAIPSALRDVDALAELLIDPDLGGFEAEAVRVLKDPARTEMETAVEALFTNRASDDLLLLYFSGHGLRDERRQLFLACCETAKVQEGPARGRLRHATALRARTLQEYMQASPSKRQLVILDCCFSGAMAIGMTVKDEGRIDLAEELGGEGCAVLTSSAATELSQAGAPRPGAPQEHGAALAIYTRFLVEGIRTGAADRRERGVVDAEDLHEYARGRLGEVNPAQTPEFYPTRAGHSIIISRVPRDPAVEYRKQLQTLAEERLGVISSPGRIFLDDLRLELGLSQPEAERIEAEVLQPFREYEVKLNRYLQSLEAMVAALPEPGSGLSPLDRQDLSRLENRFQLRSSDVQVLHARLGIHFGDGRNPHAAETLIQPSRPAATSENRSALKTIVVSHGWVIKKDKRLEVKTKPVEVQGFKEDLATGVALTMLRIPAGEFVMGSPNDEEGRSEDEGPQHQVTLRAFFMAQTPITQAQWKVVAGWEKVQLDLNPDPSRSKGENRPVERVSWDEAQEFCRRLSQHNGRTYRLPSEAEWEYACRAGTTTPFHFGEALTLKLAHYNNVALQGNPSGWDPSDIYFGDRNLFSGFSGSELSSVSEENTSFQHFAVSKDVGSYPANAWGLQDLHGNVWEWCEDHSHKNYSSARSDGKAWVDQEDEWIEFEERPRLLSFFGPHVRRGQKKRLLRGGASIVGLYYSRSADRFNAQPDAVSSFFGFRPCCSLSPEPFND